MIEPSYDPTDTLNRAIDAGREPAVPIVALDTLTKLLFDLDISKDEHDAGEVFFRVCRIALSNVNDKTPAPIALKLANGKWQASTLTPDQAVKLQGVALSKIRSQLHRQAVNRALGVERPSIEWKQLHRLIGGLEDLARFWICANVSTPAVTTNALGVTLPKTTGKNDATPERLNKIEDALSITESDGVRRIVDTPFERMRNRRQIDRDDGLNELLYAAGTRYFQDWHFAGMSGLSSFDMAKPLVDGGKASSGAIPERQLERLQAFSDARSRLGPRYWQVVDPIVIEELTLAQAGGLLGYSLKTGKIIARERLNEGLRRLAVHYQLMRVA